MAAPTPMHSCSHTPHTPAHTLPHTHLADIFGSHFLSISGCACCSCAYRWLLLPPIRPAATRHKYCICHRHRHRLCTYASYICNTLSLLTSPSDSLLRLVPFYAAASCYCSAADPTNYFAYSFHEISNLFDVSCASWSDPPPTCFCCTCR